MLSCQVFAFREVYNEKLFLQNGKVLVEVVELFQNYKMAYTSKEQLLGDLFENLLNQGFKQEAGQFFTPIPITRFVWNSLPIERFLDANKLTVPRVVDFACGSGHFLTEGISAISDFYNDGKEQPAITDKDISKSFFGVDKDNRLARVSKVAMLLNGANDANIMAADGLEHDENFYQGGLHSFDILVANPPYSVDGFKTHESRKVQNAYETIKLMSFTCKDIQNVFIERMHHLLKPKGIAGIVMPSSILNSTDNASIMTREIILQNFYVRAIASFAGKTFGETNTSTIILFLEHFDFPPKKAQMLKDSVAAILSNEELTDWDDKNIFENYLRTINVEQTDYERFIRKEETLFENTFATYFKEYEKAFLEITDVKKALVKIAETEKKERAGATLKKNEKTSVAQKRDLSNDFYSFVKEIEYQKLLHFALTYREQTLLITAPTDTNEQKKFLGYDFSHRRGDEGIKETEGLLSSRSKRNDENKLAWFVRKAFGGEQYGNEELDKYVNYTHTSNLLSFTRPSFDLQMKLAVENKIEVKSKYPLVKLGTIAPYVSEKIDFSEISIEDYISTDNMLQNRKGVVKYSGDSSVDRITKYEIDDILVSNIRPYLKKIWLANKDGGCSNDVIVFRADREFVFPKFLFEIMSQDIFFDFMMSEKKGIKMPRGDKDVIPTFQVPLPPINIQKLIVSECEKVDKEYTNAQKQIEESKSQISEAMQNAKGETRKLKDVCIYNKYSINPTDSPEKEFIYIDIDSVINGTGIVTFGKRILGKDAPSRARRIAKDKSTLVSTVRPNLKGFAYIEKEIDDAVYSTGFAIFETKDETVLLSKVIYYSFMYSDYMMQQMLQAMPKGQYPSINNSDIDNFEIVVPSIEDQQKIVKQIETYETAITEAKAVMDSCAEKKKMVLEKWLK